MYVQFQTVTQEVLLTALPLALALASVPCAMCIEVELRVLLTCSVLRVQELVLVVHDATAASEVTEVHHWQPACEVPPCGAEESAAYRDARIFTARKLKKKKKCVHRLDLMSSLRRGHANLLCIVPVLTEAVALSSTVRKLMRTCIYRGHPRKFQQQSLSKQSHTF